MTNEVLYKDVSIEIRNVDENFQCEWKGKEEPNHSYMTAKLVELIGSKFPGAWPVNDLKEAETSKGLRCFLSEWKEDLLTMRWV